MSPPLTSDEKSMYFGKYVSKEGSKNLKLYSYKGNDHSLIYKHVLTPMNNLLLEYLPLWLAPNLITLLGLLAVISSHLLFLYYCPSLDGECPPWVYVYAAFALFAYQTLDNLDGKQARRTGTSSPLGLLFDHGCDAINCTIGSMTMSCVVQFGAGWKATCLGLWVNMVFIAATWEEYYTGSLDLPILNGPTEGVLIAIGIKLFTAIMGPSFWLQESTILPGVLHNTIFLGVMIASSTFTVLANLINVIKTVHAQKGSFLIALTRLTPFAILNGLALLWAILSPANIKAIHPRMFLWTIGLLNSKLVLHLMLAHLCGEEYHPFRKTLVPIFYVAAHWGFSHWQGIYPVQKETETLFLNEFFFISFVAYIHIVVSVIYEVKTALGITVFTVPAANQKRD
ncbi:hypothetical protein SPRG_11691 [Saprolegnia parasitica CBS 223.65]|uniref:CDP-alcohol phosphatidyltransferase n=1 Tax=Saprolegnia parasitica (strain CBS 223.65) TaxID=695850 RepID=A0A067C6R2_SAPPC|nr:hypothetical protein SPRG_11691 [Saprolegnia parasitica CBS 223.65]KDO22507.1 hypothetical protein SPRG_11691 [Saprolegnia parasitica CBS 223.65]|eukprot:XP_012206755.1 hypothetical protein SPRG_11691 [Saprolegnia parasitica CBS 223.65]